MSALISASYFLRVERRLDLAHVEAQLLRRTSPGWRGPALAGSRTACRASPRTCPASPATRATMAAGMALGWKSSGKSRQTTRTLPLYSSRILSMVGSTREQNGHWKSENCTMVTSASLAPLPGAPLHLGLEDACSGSGAPGAGRRRRGLLQAVLDRARRRAGRAATPAFSLASAFLISSSTDGLEAPRRAARPPACGR